MSAADEKDATDATGTGTSALEGGPPRFRDTFDEPRVTDKDSRRGAADGKAGFDAEIVLGDSET